jgi:hypothetical protein
VFGPLFGPDAGGRLVQFSITHAEEQSDENISLAVTHAERAPNLLAYLTARGIDIEKVNLDEPVRRKAVVTQSHKIILDIPRTSAIACRKAAGAGGAVLGQLARLRTRAAWAACAC